MKRMSTRSLVVLAGFVMTVVAGINAQAPKGLRRYLEAERGQVDVQPGSGSQGHVGDLFSGRHRRDEDHHRGHAGHGSGPALGDDSPCYDGKEYPVKGNPNADMVSVKRVDDSTGESTFKKAGKVTATNTRKLSADGKTLTVTSKGVTEDGKPRTDVQVFEK